MRIAEKSGGKVIAPNGLPIACIRHDGTMLEHEHADHPDYKFPVVAEYTGPAEDLPEWDTSRAPETHALIYADSAVCLTLYECQYHLWTLQTGAHMGRSGYPAGHWTLTADARARIAALATAAPNRR